MSEPELGQMLFGNKWESCDCPDFVGRGLYDLSETLGRRDPENQARGLLGGEWGYGQDYDCAVFEMHPYWWGDCECGFAESDWQWSKDHHHDATCYQSQLHRERVAADLYRWDDDANGFIGTKRGFDADQAIESEIYVRLTAKHDLPMIGCAVHCTCSHNADYAAWREENDHDQRCPVVLPNFLHKPSGFAVHWYKYIGRSMTASSEIDFDQWRTILNECLAAIA